MKMSEWVNVKDRVPEPNIWVLIYEPNDQKRPIKDGQYLYTDSEYGNFWLAGYNITHWMPLPSPPPTEAPK